MKTRRCGGMSLLEVMAIITAMVVVTVMGVSAYRDWKTQRDAMHALAFLQDVRAAVRDAYAPDGIPAQLFGSRLMATADVAALLPPRWRTAANTVVLPGIGSVTAEVWTAPVSYLGGVSPAGGLTVRMNFVNEGVCAYLLAHGQQYLRVFTDGNGNTSMSAGYRIRDERVDPDVVRPVEGGCVPRDKNYPGRTAWIVWQDY
jgi:hypothetical protein